MRESYYTEDGDVKVFWDSDGEEWFWVAEGESKPEGPFATREEAAIDAGLEDFEFLYGDSVEEG
ncbi:MAG: hypothetical protein P8Z49_05670 [Acidobacteriota bacterium]|jgi:hypothetical protein